MSHPQRARRRILSHRSLARSSYVLSDWFKMMFEFATSSSFRGPPAVRKHIGRLFAAMPDGSAFVWALEGHMRAMQGNCHDRRKVKT